LQKKPDILAVVVGEQVAVTILTERCSAWMRANHYPATINEIYYMSMTDYVLMELATVDDKLSVMFYDSGRHDAVNN
jgi:hypothetical protein